MWKRTLSYGICWLFAVCMAFGENNAVLLRVNGKEVMADEFGRYLKKYAVYHPRVKPQDYLEDFVLFKLKVADALTHRWDTLPDFQRQYAALREELEERKKRIRENVGPEDWVCLSYLTIPLSQRATKLEEEGACARMDSVYSFLQKGGSFEEALIRFPAGMICRKKVWGPDVSLLKEFKEQLSMLSQGSFSFPFFSPLGVHILRYEGRECRSCTGERVIGCREEGDTEEQWYWREIRDGLLASYWDKHIRVVPDVVEGKDLESYFRTHREKYHWELPHFKGAVIHCANKKVASKIKRRLRKVPMEQWAERLDRLGQTDSLYKAEIEFGLFQIGTNAYIDRLSFKCGELPSHPRYAYSFVMGKRLKKGPETYHDVYDEVVKDFRKEKETEFLRNLTERFPVEIRQGVLKTVNCGRNNEE